MIFKLNPTVDIPYNFPKVYTVTQFRRREQRGMASSYREAGGSVMRAESGGGISNRGSGLKWCAAEKYIGNINESWR